MSYSVCTEDISDAILHDDLQYIIDNYTNFDPNCYTRIQRRYGPGIRLVYILHRAIQRRAVNIVEWLINSGADIEAIDDNEDTALFVASIVGDLDIIRLLIMNGANISAKNVQGDTPLMYAVQYDNDYDVVKLLLDAGADPNAVNKSRNTALHHASINGQFDIVKLLLDYGADKSILTEDRRSSEELASCFPQIASYIRNYQPIPTIKEPEEEEYYHVTTPLQLEYKY